MRSEKQFLLDEIKEKIKLSDSIIVTNYKSVTPNSVWDFRNKLGEMNSSFIVVKKTIFFKAIKEWVKESGLEESEINLDQLEGHIGVVFTKDDTVGPAKQIFTFNKENGAEVNVLYGILDGKRYSAKDIEALSKLPNMPEMRAQFLGLLEAPMSQTLSVMQSLLTSVIYCLDNKAKQAS